MQKDDMGVWHCLQCPFNSKRCSVVKNHVEAKHIESAGFMCPLCSTVCPTRNALTMHTGRKHKNLSESLLQGQQSQKKSLKRVFTEMKARACTIVHIVNFLLIRRQMSRTMWSQSMFQLKVSLVVFVMLFAKLEKL